MYSFVSGFFHLVQDFGDSSRLLHLSVVGTSVVKVNLLDGQEDFEVEEGSGQ